MGKGSFGMRQHANASQQLFQKFFQNEQGAITIDWVILVAGVAVLAVTVMSLFGARSPDYSALDAVGQIAPGYGTMSEAMGSEDPLAFILAYNILNSSMVDQFDGAPEFSVVQRTTMAIKYKVYAFQVCLGIGVDEPHTDYCGL